MRLAEALARVRINDLAAKSWAEFTDAAET